MERYVTIVETLCREVPWNWFNFFDFWADDATSPTPVVL
jgi:predicted LPLAT superfamily acyltransferase